MEEILRQLEERYGQLERPEEPSWIPCTAFTPEFYGSVMPQTPRRGEPIDRRIWRINRLNTSTWNTIISNRPLTQGAHYWEIKLLSAPKENGSDFKFGIAFPRKEYKIGESVLNNWFGNSGMFEGDYISLDLQVGLRYSYRGTPNAGYAHKIMDNLSPLTGCRFGLFLDLPRSSLTLYIFESTNNTNVPTKEILIATLPTDREFYPVFCLYNNTTTVELTIDAPPPTGINEYLQQMQQMIQLMEQMRRQLELMRHQGREQDANYLGLLERYLDLVRRTGGR